MRTTADSWRWVADGEGTWLCLRCPKARSVCEGMKPGKLYDVELKEHRGRRSLDANAYCWVLLDRLAEALSVKGAVVTKEELYRRIVRDVPGTSETVCVQDKAVEKLRQGWAANGLGWTSDTMPSKLPGCTNVILHYGSSIFDTHQMSRLIDMVVEECKAQGVETMTPEQLKKLEGYMDESES